MTNPLKYLDPSYSHAREMGIRNGGSGVEPTNYEDVRAFQLKFGQLTGDVPRHLLARKLKERLEFIREEFYELCDAGGINRVTLEPIEGAEQDLPLQADALIDIAYVVMGTAAMMGLPWQALWDDVQRANMSKELGATHRGHSMDVRKPIGWIGPKTLEILRDHGYDVTLPTYVDDAEHMMPTAEVTNDHVE